MRGKYDIYIFQEAGQLVVYPEVATFTKGDNKPVRFRNLTDTEVTLEFDDDLFDEPRPYQVPVSNKDYMLKPKAEGVYRYTVKESGRAGKTADPKIIVDP